MPKLINKSEVIENIWQTLDKDFSGELPEGSILAPLNYLLENPLILDSNPNIGIWLDSDQSSEALEPYLDKLSLIAINFPKFVDGRGYSYARILRDRLDYQGELRAIGDVLHDQLFYLKRCGFDSFAVREDKNIEIASQGLEDFSDSYQIATDQPEPLFRRR